MTGAYVFDYFYKHYLYGFRDDFMDEIQNILNDGKHEGYSVIFTGHSLGGAMTVHAAADFALTGLSDVHATTIYTYGQPRVGNPQFTDPVKSKVVGWYRLVHNRDIVAHIPPCVPDLHSGCLSEGSLPFYPYHAAEEIFYDPLFIGHIGKFYGLLS